MDSLIFLVNATTYTYEKYTQNSTRTIWYGSSVSTEGLGKAPDKGL